MAEKQKTQHNCHLHVGTLVCLETVHLTSCRSADVAKRLLLLQRPVSAGSTHRGTCCYPSESGLLKIPSIKTRLSSQLPSTLITATSQVPSVRVTSLQGPRLVTCFCRVQVVPAAPAPPPPKVAPGRCLMTSNSKNSRRSALTTSI